jgi:TRAP transporter TAXI family solute receptor
MVHLVTRALLLLLVLALAGCARGPDATDVREALQKQLDDALGGRVLAIESLKRAGGAPGRDGATRVVHYNASLKLARDYDFTKWDGHSVTSLANLLGAGSKGVVGIKAEGNRAGDVLGVFGTAAFAGKDGRYALVPSAPAAPSEVPLPAAAAAAAVQPRAREVPPPTAAQAAHERLADLFTAPMPRPLTEGERDTILREEFEQAYARARARLDKAAQVSVLASGPSGGAYAELARALEERAARAAVPFEALPTEGSLGNIRLLSDGTAQFALVQNDVARSAHAGRGRFSGAPRSDMRAVASLFPEVVHLVARADAGIAGIADLRGKRVDLGLPGSGTRNNAAALLDVSGVSAGELASVSDSSLPDAAEALAAGRIDAFFATIHAPAREIAALATRTKLVFVPIGPSRELIDSGLLPLTLPVLTYAGQTAPVPTLAATALLATRADVAPASVEAMLGLLFARREGAATAAVAQVAMARARDGLTIPLHPAAERWLAAHAAPTAAPVAAPAPAAR